MTSLDPDIARSVDEDIVRSAPAARPARLLSLDVMRGLTIGLMIVVNDQMGPAPFGELVHAQWNGLTLTDLVFPTFLFLVGLTTVLSMAARQSRGATRQELFLHALRRALLLIAFGFVVNNFPLFHLSTARYYGVLPRIGLCYFVVASLYLLSPGWRSKVAIAVACLVGYWALMRFVPVPGFGVPTHGVPINDHDGNLAAWLDRALFSAPHLYERTRDPEGLLSTLPALATTLLGLLTGLWLRTNRTTAHKASTIASAGLLLVLAGAAWNPWFPINKKLWTSSYVLTAGGITLMLLALCILVVDLLRVGRAPAETDDPTSGNHPLLYRPWLVLGTNAILAYMISELLDPILRLIPIRQGLSLKAALLHAVAKAIPSPQWGSLVYSLLYLLVCWLLVYPFYRKRVFLRI